jgi:DNA-directed RNA polymerase subunit M/transcription elongation factor TFIIS
MRIIKITKKDGENFGICVKGHITPLETQESHAEANEKKKTIYESMVIIDKDQYLKEQTITSLPCPYCGSRKSKLVRSFMLYGDEDQVNIMKCLNCGKNFRVGKGVSGE